MAKASAVKSSGPLKIAGGVLLLGASIAFMIHRMPHREYVAVHADHPRPSPAWNAPVSPTARPVAQPVAPPVVEAVPAPSNFALSTPMPASDSEPAPKTTIGDLTDECWSEIGILCHGVPDKRLAGCLDGYDDALMSSCRLALERFQSPRSSVDAESGL